MIFTPTSRAMVVYDAMALLKDDRKIIIISINEYNDDESVMKPPKGLPIAGMPMLKLNFTDIPRRVSNYKMFDGYIAQSIFAFVGFYDKADVCLVHCHAGISRSPAVCAGLSLHYNKKCDEYFEKYVPNTLVFYRMIEQSYKLKTKEKRS